MSRYPGSAHYTASPVKSTVETLEEIKELLDSSKRVDGKLSDTTVRKAEKLLADAV